MVLQLSLLTAPVHLLDQHCSGTQIMPTLKLLPELEDETSLIKTIYSEMSYSILPATDVVLVYCCGGVF